MPDTDVRVDDWFCEEHHWLNWPHDDCIGPGIPASYAMRLCVRDVARLRALVHEIEDFAKDENPGLRLHIQKVLARPLGVCGSQAGPDTCCDKDPDHEGGHYDSATGESW